MRELVSSSASTTGLLVAAGGAALGGWWEDVNASPAWQDGAFFSLSAAYALVSAVALVSLPALPSPRRIPQCYLDSSSPFDLKWAGRRLAHGYIRQSDLSPVHPNS
jgi:hypothetical protein